ncbi:hypothetical protein ABPG77_009492 [Micractinium sp. CCAP 211/92]
MPSGASGGASALSSVFTLLNSAVGAGVLSLPFAFYAAGWAGGLLATATVASIEAFTLYVLARYAEVTGSATYSGLVRNMLGRKASAAMSVVLIIYSYGSATAYLIILGDCFQPMLEQAFGQEWWTERNVVILALSTAFMLPLCFPRTLNAISGFSSVTFYALLVVVGSVIYRAVEALQAPGYDWGVLQAWRPPRYALDALPILAFGFQCHTNLVAVFSELEEEPELGKDLFSSTASLSSLLTAGGDGAPGGNGGAANSAGAPAVGTAEAGSGAEPGSGDPAGQGRAQGNGEGSVRVVLLSRPQRRFVAPAQRTPKLRGMVRVVCASIGISAAFYSLVGLFGYATFPTNTRSNILLNYPTSDKLMQVARVLVGIIQIIHYPVNHAPARNATRDLLTQLTGCSPVFRGYNTVEVFFFFVCTLGLSLLVTDLGDVFKLIGGSCGSFFIFGMPGALLLQYAWSKHVQVRQGHPLEQPLLAEEGATGGAQQAQQATGLAAQQAMAPQAQVPQRYHVLLSKLFWAGVLLILLALGLLALTLYTLIAPHI